jgi:hypothetical protein
MADTRTFPATPATLATLQTMLTSHGVNVDLMQPAGRAQAEGWDISWVEGNGTIAFTVWKYPGWKLQETVMWGKLAAILT